MSMGYLVGENAPVVWRGPMVMKAIQQLLHEVEWGGLDVLVLDLPPGTGDTQLTITQQVILDGKPLRPNPSHDLALTSQAPSLSQHLTHYQPKTPLKALTCSRPSTSGSSVWCRICLSSTVLTATTTRTCSGRMIECRGYAMRMIFPSWATFRCIRVLVMMVIEANLRLLRSRRVRGPRLSRILHGLLAVWWK